MKGIRHILLFDSDCMACSKVARAVEDLSATDLEIMSLRDPRVTDWVMTSSVFDGFRS